MQSPVSYPPVTTSSSSTQTPVRSIQFPVPSDGGNNNIHFNIDLATDPAFTDIIHSVDTTIDRTGCYLYSGSLAVEFPELGAAPSDYESIATWSFPSDLVKSGVQYFARIRTHNGTSWSDYSGRFPTW